MTAQTSAGSVLAISAAAPATFDEAGFEALDFTEIGEVTNIDGNIGRTYGKAEHKPLASRATVKLKTSYDSGSANVQMAMDRGDAGQQLAETALTSDDSVSFCLTEQDGAKIYWRGMVMGFPFTTGNTESVASRALSVEITANDDGEDFVIVLP